MDKLPITPELEIELIEAGAFDSTGYILRPKLRAVFDRIAHDNGSRWTLFPIRRAQHFILLLHRMAKKSGISFDEYCEKLNY